MRLHLRGLELLSAGNGTLRVQTAVRSQPPYEKTSEIFAAGTGEPERIDETSPFWLPIRIEDRADPQHPVIPLEDGYFELHIPDALLSDNPEIFSIFWIDFFRG